MKKNLFNVSAMIVALSLFTLQACKDDDTTPPVISLAGNSTQTISLNSTYNDAGATATDDEDGTVSVTTDASGLNVNLVGTYSIYYSAMDAAGNQGTATRTVIVKNDADYLVGTYLTTEGSSTWSQNITASATVNNRIHFSYFANYSNNDDIYAQVTGTQVELPTTQNALGIGASSCDHTFTPNGTGNPVTTTGTISFSIKFTDQQLSGPGCTATGAVPYEDVFVKQ
jgi:hypothetical protein